MGVSNQKSYTRPYKSYVAFLNQTSTNAPIATVLENKDNLQVNFSYDSQGQYSCEVAGATSVCCFITNNNGSVFIWAINEGSFIYFKVSTFTEFPNIDYVDDQLVDTPFEIRVYS